MIITLDIESFYSSDYSLRKMSEIDYVLDPRFQMLMCAIKINDEPIEVIDNEPDLIAKCASIDWSRVFMISHNSRFDASILAWRYGVRPAMYGCTLSMARAMTHAVVGRSSLDAVAKYLDLPPKGTEVVMAMGKRRENFSHDEFERYKAYCAHDTELCREIFDIFMRAGFPKTELDVIDMVMRMFVEPQVYLNAHVLAEHLHDVEARKVAIMERVNHIQKDVFSSSLKFAQLLRDHGVEPPMKPSPATGDPIPALARTDRAFKELCDDDTQPLEIQAFLAARLNSKSTLEETRTRTLLRLSLRDWGGGEVGKAPVPLKYSGAHTHRLSGDGGFNWQNFSRESRIREAVQAPPGMRIVHRDASQIEARMVAFLAGCQSLLNAFSQGRDVYSEFATEVFGRRITKADKPQRFAGKVCILSLGFGVGPERLRHQLFIGQGVAPNNINLVIDEGEAKRIVWLYRRTYSEIQTLWNYGELALSRMIVASNPLSREKYDMRSKIFDEQIEPLPCITVGHDALWLPSGMCIAYPNIRRRKSVPAINPIVTPGGDEIIYDGPYKEARKMYGAKVIENVAQALARIVVTDTMRRVKHETGYTPFLMTHDSTDYVVPESDAEAMDAYLEREYAVRPAWASTLPLASEGGWGRTLVEAEQGFNR